MHNVLIGVRRSDMVLPVSTRNDLTAQNPIIPLHKTSESLPLLHIQRRLPNTRSDLLDITNHQISSDSFTPNIAVTHAILKEQNVVSNEFAT